MKCFVPATVLLALSASLLTVTTIDALSIDRSNLTASTITNDKYQRLERTWTVASAEQLRHLVVDVPGNVFVEYDSSLKAVATDAATTDSVVAKIVVRGDNETLLDVFEVVPVRLRHNGRVFENDDDIVREDSVQLRLKRVNAELQGRVLTTIAVADKHALYALSTAMTHDMVVRDNVLASDDAKAAVTLSTAGSGDLFVAMQDAAFAADSLAIATAGAGGVQFSASSLSLATGVRLSVAGSGDVAVLTTHDVHAASLASEVAGSGRIFVQADSSVVVGDLATSISGSGDVTLSTNGTCGSHHIDLSGSGRVAAGSIVCRDTKVSIVGSGDVVVQSTESLRVDVIASGSVQYVNARPAIVKENSLFASHHHHDNKLVTQATTNAFKTYKTVAIPARATKTVKLTLREGPSIYSHADDDDYPIDDEENESRPFGSSLRLAAVGSRAGRNTNSSTAPMAVVGVAGLALAAVGALVHKVRQQRSREEYSPLVHGGN